MPPAAARRRLAFRASLLPRVAEYELEVEGDLAGHQAQTPQFQDEKTDPEGTARLGLKES